MNSDQANVMNERAVVSIIIIIIIIIIYMLGTSRLIRKVLQCEI
jgi:hypothetical protein